MWVVFQKSDRKIVSMGASSPRPMPKEQAIAEIVRGLGEGHDAKDYDAVEVQDHAKIGAMLTAISEGKARVEEKAQGLVELVDETVSEAVSLVVTVEGEHDLHPVDQVPLIPANPAEFIVIRVQKVDSRGKPLTRKTVDKEVLWLRTDHGSLRANTGTGTSGGTLSGSSGGVLVGGTAGTAEIRSVTLASGAASFRLHAEPAKRLATVQILHQDPSLRATVRVEFI